MPLKSFTLSLCALVISGVASLAANLPEPHGPIVLEISGSIENTNLGKEAGFDVEMMRELDWQTVETHTPFTDGPQVFAGPTLSSVLTYVGASGTQIKATAINDYFVEIPMTDAEDHGVILALEHNGVPMRIRDKGPIWVVYPQSEREAANKTFENEMVWQLNRMSIQGE